MRSIVSKHELFSRAAAAGGGGDQMSYGYEIVSFKCSKSFHIRGIFKTDHPCFNIVNCYAVDFPIYVNITAITFLQNDSDIVEMLNFGPIIG